MRDLDTAFLPGPWNHWPFSMFQLFGHQLNWR
jgi:hypothetical protein